jgi:hypothetical protein
MESPDNSDRQKFRRLEYAVPLLSFGGALVAILLWMTNIPFDYRFTILGCVFASWVLAYLSWMRPKKDIVGLTTPLYSFIFLAVPTDFSSALVLEILYAVSLTILLVRLKYRFGVAHTPSSDGKSLEEPLKEYVETLQDFLKGVNPEVAHQSGLMFLHFARTDYREVAQIADAAIAGMESSDVKMPVLTTAFGIVKEQAMLLEESRGQPVVFQQFSADDASMLAKPLPAEEKVNDRFETALDNALLLLFAAAWNGSADDKSLLLTGQSFAQRLIAD